MHVSYHDGRTDRRNTPVPLICLLTGMLDRRKTKVSEIDTLIKRHVGTKLRGKNVVYELLKITNRKMTTVRTNT